MAEIAFACLQLLNELRQVYNDVKENESVARCSQNIYKNLRSVE